jgi:hypothetical protein
MTFIYKELWDYIDNLIEQNDKTTGDALFTLKKCLRKNLPFNHPRIKNNTGAVIYRSVYQLEKQIKIANSTINDHLNILESKGYIWRLRRENMKNAEISRSNGFPSAIYIFPRNPKYNSGFLKDIKECKNTRDFKLMISKYVLASTNFIKNPDLHINGDSEIKYRKSDATKKYLEIMISGLAHVKMYTDGNHLIHKMPFYKCKLKCDIIKIYMTDNNKINIPKDNYAVNKVDIGKQYKNLIKFSVYHDH